MMIDTRTYFVDVKRVTDSLQKDYSPLLIAEEIAWKNALLRAVIAEGRVSDELRRKIETELSETR